MLEIDIVKKCVDYIKKTSAKVKVETEVPFLSRCIDVIIIDESNNIISIEFKVNNWKQAIEQAKNHKLGADRAYICIPKRALSVQLEESIKNAGVGLLFFDESSDSLIEEIIPPLPKKQNIFKFKEMLLKTVNKIQNN